MTPATLGQTVMALLTILKEKGACIVTKGHRPNGFLGLSLINRAILFLVILLDKTVSVG